MTKKEFMCDSCSNAEIKIVEIYKPSWASSRVADKREHLAVWCKNKSCYIQKFVTFREAKKNSCGYRPKAGKINKKIEQKTLF